MTILSEQQVFIDQFFSTIDSFHGNNQNISFNYIAVKRGEDFYLIQGALTFNTAPPRISLPHFRSNNIRAGIYLLAELKLDARGLVSALLSGRVSTPGGDLFFPGGDSGNYGVLFDPFHREGTKVQARYNVLSLLGAAQASFIRQPFFDWELRAAPTPYEGLQELALDYKLGALRDAVSVELIAFHVAAVDFASVMSGSNAKVGVFLAHGMPPDGVTLGYRVIDQGKVKTRSIIEGCTMQWVQTAEHQYGSAEIVVPPAAVIHCFVSYRGIAQHFGWVSDPATMQNPKRAVYNKFDNNLETLKDFLTKSGTKGRNARDLETGVAWLLWMLGFSVAHLGGTGRTQDAVDLIATTSKGDFAIIECTTGLLKADNKLSLLIGRAEHVRAGIVASNNKHLRVLPVIVTSRARAEISADIEHAEKLGVLVITSENLERAIASTLVLPNAEKMYEEALQSVEDAKAKHEIRELPPVPWTAD